MRIMSAEEIIRKVEELKRSKVRKLVEEKIREFEKMRNKGEEAWFSELCFCILTANYTAEGGLRIQKALGAEGFLKLSYEELVSKLKQLGHRFPRARARYIVEARRYFGKLKKNVLAFSSGKKAREWLLQIKGIGLKEASHFLRNVGFKDVAIIDRHILKILREAGLINFEKITRKRYFEAEKKLEMLAERLNLDLARLDLYLWYLKTGKVLK